MEKKDVSRERMRLLLTMVISPMLRRLGEHVFLLDSCCSPSAMVLNTSRLCKDFYESNKQRSTGTLGGEYHAPLIGNFKFFDMCDYDPDLPMSILSWYRLLQLGCSIEQHNDTHIIHFPSIPVTLHASWIDGVLAGDLTPLSNSSSSTLIL